MYIFAISSCFSCFIKGNQIVWIRDSCISWISVENLCNYLNYYLIINVLKFKKCWIFYNFPDFKFSILFQGINSKRFSRFDYEDPLVNMQVYGNTSPPDYDLSMVQVRLGKCGVDFKDTITVTKSNNLCCYFVWGGIVSTPIMLPRPLFMEK